VPRPLASGRCGRSLPRGPDGSGGKSGVGAVAAPPRLLGSGAVVTTAACGDSTGGSDATSGKDRLSASMRPVADLASSCAASRSGFVSGLANLTGMDRGAAARACRPEAVRQEPREAFRSPASRAGCFAGAASVDAGFGGNCRISDRLAKSGGLLSDGGDAPRPARRLRLRRGGFGGGPHRLDAVVRRDAVPDRHVEACRLLRSRRSRSASAATP